MDVDYEELAFADEGNVDMVEAANKTSRRSLWTRWEISQAYSGANRTPGSATELGSIASFQEGVFGGKGLLAAHAVGGEGPFCLFYLFSPDLLA